MTDKPPLPQGSRLSGTAVDGLVDTPVVANHVAVPASAARRMTLALILAASAFMNFFQLSRLGYGNTYYAAGVKSMLMSWHNFFFVSFDPGGFVTIDKPPLGFWIQAASAEIFGFHGWSLILPEALAGVGSVALIYVLVRRFFGDLASLLAAAFMATAPVAVATDRSNIVDTLLVFTVLLGAWVVLHATETGQFRWLVLSMVLIGLGFNIKMLEAYLVVPAFVAVYLLGAQISWRTKIWHLALAGIVLMVVSLSWATAVDLTPPTQRPYVGSSDNNSEYNLIFGYNGLNRLLSGSWSFLGLHGRNFGRLPAVNTAPPSTRNTGVRFGFGEGENGAPGLLRLINQQLSGQTGWLLPLALIGIVAAGWQRRPRLPLEGRHRSILFWGVWLITGVGFFSIAGFFHAYYLVMIAPPIAALGGAGLASMWHDYRGSTWRGWLLPFSLVGVALVQQHILHYFANWHPWVATSITLTSIAVAAVLIVFRALDQIVSKHENSRFPNLVTRGGVAMLAIGILTIGLAPTAWAADTTLYGSGGLLPMAGPAAGGGFGGGRRGFQFATSPRFDIPGLPNVGAVGSFAGQIDPLTLQYLLNNQGRTEYLVATLNATSAAPIILATGRPVMALGGFTGTDPILSISDLQHLINNGTVRFFLVQGGFGGRGGFGAPRLSRGRGNSSGITFGVEPGSGQVTRARIGEPGLKSTDSVASRGSLAEPTPVSLDPAVPAAVLIQWVTSNCSPVNPTAINGTQSGLIRGSSLYDCRP